MLGSCKLLTFGIVSALVLSLLIVGAFAAEPEDVKALGGGGGFVKVPAPDSVQVPASPFRTVYTWRTTANEGTATFAEIATEDSPLLVHFVYYAPNYSAVLRLEFDHDVPFYLVRGSGNAYTVYVNGVAYEYSRIDFGVAFVFGSYSSFPASNMGSRSTLTGYLNPLPVLGSILGIGTALVAFVVARPIVLIPIVAMILVLSYGVIRRLIKGV